MQVGCWRVDAGGEGRALSGESTTARPLEFLDLDRDGRSNGNGDGNGDAPRVTLTVTTLAAALRVGNTSEELAQVARLLALASAAVTKHAPDAPAIFLNEATVRVAAYLYDMPQASRGAAYGDVLRNSGALALLLPYRVHRAGSTAASEAS